MPISTLIGQAGLAAFRVPAGASTSSVKVDGVAGTFTVDANGLIVVSSPAVTNTSVLDVTYSLPYFAQVKGLARVLSWFRPAGDGASDDAATLTQAAALGSSVDVGDFDLLVKTNAGTGFTTVSKSGFVGRGEGSSINIREESATGTSEVISVTGPGLLLERLKLAFTKALTGVSTAIFLKTRQNKIVLRNAVIDGGITLVGGTADRSVQLVKSHAGAGTNTVVLENLDVTSVSRVYTRDNGDTDSQSIVKVLGGIFRNIWRTAFTFNAPSGAIEDVLVQGATFNTHAGVANADPGVSGNSNAVGFVGVRGGRAIGNHVTGIYGAVVHIEENTDGAVVLGNTARMANASAADGALETLANNIGGSTVVPVHLAHVANVLRSTDGVGTGMYVQSQLSSDGCRWSSYTGNISSGFTNAFKADTDTRSVLVSHNVLRGTTSALNLARASLLAMNNVVEDCATPVKLARGGLMGAVHYVNLSGATAAITAWASTTSGPATLTEWTWETDLFNTVNGSQNLDIGPMPTRAFGTCTVALTQSSSVHRLAVIELTYDGTTVTTTSKLSYGAGLITITGIANNAGKLAITLNDTNAGGSTNVRVQVRFSGGAFVA